MDDDNDDEVGWGLASEEKEAKEDIFWDQKMALPWYIYEISRNPYTARLSEGASNIKVS